MSIENTIDTIFYDALERSRLTTIQQKAAAVTLIGTATEQFADRLKLVKSGCFVKFASINYPLSFYRNAG